MAKNKNYMRIYMAQRRAAKKGFSLVLARWAFNEMINRGVARDDALWAIQDAAAHGCFGELSTQ